MRKGSLLKDYPLRWPQGWQRTMSFSRKSPGTLLANQAQSIAELEEELERMGGRDIVLTTNQRRGENPQDPGAAVYFTRNGKDQCIPCDKYDQLYANIRAIGLTVNALRSIERWGTPTMIDAAFSGFEALPAPGQTTKPGWWDALGVTSSASKEEIRQAYQRKVKIYHPDNQKTGNRYMFEVVQEAYKEATNDHL